MFKSILCPVDFSAHSERALGYAIQVAALTGAHLTIMTAVDPFLDAASAAAGHGEALMRQTQGEMQQLLSRIRDKFAVELELSELFQEPTIAALAAAITTAMHRNMPPEGVSVEENR